ncbi:MAG: RDD family protein [Chloroflexota bacterium]|nr:RDD family protein [Chloroflexota bacterium]
MGNQQTPEIVAYAGFWRRLFAYLIDALLLSIAGSLALPMTGLGLLGQYPPGIPSWYGPLAPFEILIASLSGLFSLVITACYFIVFWVWKGQTLGKMALGIKIIRGDGSGITFENALLRFLGYFICFIFAYIPFLWIAFDRHKQGIQDKIADTYVIKLPPSGHITS